MSTLSAADQITIAKFLGLSITPGTNTMIQSAIARLTQAGPAAIDEVSRVLLQLRQIEEQLQDARLGAGQSFRSGASGTAQYFRGDRMNELRSAGRQQVAWLSQMLGLAIVRDVFAVSALPSGAPVVRG